MKKTMCIAVLAAVVSGCGGGSSDGVIKRGDSDTGLVTELEGKWVKSCSAVDQADSETLYDIVELTFINNKVHSSIHNFIDSDCSVPFSKSLNPKASADFRIGDKVMISGGQEATEIDSHIERSEGAPFIANEFDVYLISNDRLYFGDTNGDNDGSMATLRPQSLNYNRRYIEQ